MGLHPCWYKQYSEVDVLEYFQLIQVRKKGWTENVYKEYGFSCMLLGSLRLKVRKKKKRRVKMGSEQRKK